MSSFCRLRIKVTSRFPPNCLHIFYSALVGRESQDFGGNKSKEIFSGNNLSSFVVQFLSHVCFFATPMTEACQAALSFTISWNLLKLTSIKPVMPSNHLIFCCHLLLLFSIFLSIRVFSSELALCIRWPKYWSFSFIINPSSE